MDAVPKKGTQVISKPFIYGIMVAAILGIAQEWMGHIYYDELTQQWQSPLNKSWIRFGIREAVIYLNLWVGYRMLKRLHPNTPLPAFFAIFTIALDLFFVCSGALRLFYPNFLPLVKQYGNLFYYLTTGILFVFFHALGIAWPTLNTTIFKDQ